MSASTEAGDPSARTRRSSPRTMTRSAMIGTISSSWVATISVRPAADRRTIKSTRSHFVRGSSEAVGSSSRSTSGRNESTEAIDARFFSPPDSSNGARSARWAISMAASASSQRRLTSSRLSPSWSGPKATSSRTVALNSWMSGSWKTRPTSRWKRKPSSPCGDGGYIPAQRPHRPVRGPHDAVEKLEQGRLAAAVGAEQDDPLARPYPQVDAVEGDLPARVDVANLAQLEQRLVRRHGDGLDGGFDVGRHGSTRPASTAAAATAVTPRQSSQVRDAEPVRRVGPYLAGEATRQHRGVDVVAHLEGTAHEIAHGARDPAALLSAARPAHDAALSRQQDPVGRVQEEEDVAVGHRQDEDEHLRHPERPKALENVRPRRRHHQEHRQRNRDADAADEDRRTCQPVPRRRQVGGPEREVEDPRTGHEEDGRQDHDPGEERDAQPDALDEEAERDPAGPRRAESRHVQDRQTGERSGQAGRQDRHQHADDLRPRVAPLEPAGGPGVVLGEDGLLDVAGDAAEGLLEPADPTLGPAILAAGAAAASAARHAPAPSGTRSVDPRRRSAGQDVGRPADEHDSQDAGDLVAHGRVPERRAGVGEERQRYVVARQGRTEEAREILQPGRDVAECRPDILAHSPLRTRNRGRSGRAAL